MAPIAFLIRSQKNSQLDEQGMAAQWKAEISLINQFQIQNWSYQSSPTKLALVSLLKKRERFHQSEDFIVVLKFIITPEAMRNREEATHHHYILHKYTKSLPWKVIVTPTGKKGKSYGKPQDVEYYQIWGSIVVTSLFKHLPVQICRTWHSPSLGTTFFRITILLKYTAYPIKYEARMKKYLKEA